MKPRVLFVTYGGGHAAMMAPVAKALLLRHSVDLTVLGLTTGGRVYREAGVPARGYADYAEPADGAALRLGEKLVGDVNNEAVGVSRAESIAYMGLSMADLVAEIGEEAAWTRYNEMGRHAFLPRRTLGRIIDRERPDLVVATSSPKSERAAVLEANARGIPSLIMPDLFAAKAWETYSPFEAEWYGAMCDATVDNLVADHGAAPERCVVTGQPAFQKNVPSPRECHAYAREILGVPGLGRYVVIVTSWDLPIGKGRAPTNLQGQAVVEHVAAIADCFDGLTFVVKPHPSEDAAAYEKAVQGSKRMILGPARCDLNRLLGGADAVLGASITTALVDALALDRPVAAVNLPRLDGVFPFESLAVPVATRLEDVETTLRSMLGDGPLPARQREIRRGLVELNASAVENLADLVETLARGKTPAPRRQPR